MKALRYSYVGRKNRKREFRRLWISRINAAARLENLKYSKFMYLLKKSNIGDIIIYLTKNQLGVKTYEVVMVNNIKNINLIGDYEGLFSDPEHPEYDIYN